MARQVLAEQQPYAEELRRTRAEENFWAESQGEALLESGVTMPGENESDQEDPDQDPGDDLPF